MFSSSERFQQTIQIMNRVDDKKFLVLLQRIVGKLDSKDEAPFSEAEEAQLIEGLGVGGEELQMLLNGCAYLFEQAVYHSASVDALSGELSERQLDAAKVELVGRAWGEARDALLERMGALSLSPYQMGGMGWRLKIQLSTCGELRRKTPGAVFQFQTQNADDDFEVEFRKESLFAFFHQIEQISAQLDNLS